ncbi:MAG TPA: hypothetical protein VGH19_13675 [Verrucomicrobiae bacterium]
MNISSGFILVSLGLNAALAAGVVHKLKTPAVMTVPPAAEARAAGAPAPGTATTAITAPSAPVEPKEKPFHWRMLESEDYRQYVANLRAIKCPEQTIQDIVYADLERLLAKKFRALNAKYKMNRDNTHGDYWKSDEEFLLSKYERDREGRKVHDERRESLIELLGMDAEQQRRQRLGLADYDSNVYPFMNTRETAAIRDVWADFKDRETQAQQKYGGYHGPEAREEMHRLALERDEAASKALTPQQKEEWMLRVSHVANLMRSSIGAFEPSEQEFRALYKVEYDQYLKIGPYAYMGSMDPDDAAGLALKQETQQAKEAAIRQLLGEARYQEYAMVQSRDFQDMYRFAQSSGLGKEAATQVYQIKQALDTELAQLRSNTALDPLQRSEASNGLYTKTAESVKQVLGETAYKRYESSYGGWVRGSVTYVRSASGDMVPVFNRK